MERSWYYSKDRTDRQGPVSTEQLRTMIDQGAVPTDALVWSEGMTDWTPVATQADLQPANKSPATPPPNPDTAAYIPANLGGWLRFVGTMSILMGALYCATCVGILWGVLLIIGGVALLGAQSAMDQITEVPPAFVPFLDRLNTFFLVTGVAYIIMLISIALGFIFYGGILIAAVMSME